MCAWMVGNGWAMAGRSADPLRSTVGNEDRARFLRKGFWKETQPHRTSGNIDERQSSEGLFTTGLRGKRGLFPGCRGEPT